jgi:DNA-binding phage protein
MMVKVSKFDAADYLSTPAALAAYLAEALATGDAEYIRIARDTVIRARRRQAGARSNQ